MPRSHVNWKRTSSTISSIPAWFEQSGKDIALVGSSDLASTFIQHDLIDEYRLLLTPVALGAGQPLFKGLPNGRLWLKLESTQAFPSGVVALTYVRAAKK